MNTDRLRTFEVGQHTVPVSYGETSQVADGVTCDTYTFDDDKHKDLGIVHVAAGAKTPRQRIVSGDLTVEQHVSGRATLRVEREDGLRQRFRFRGDLSRRAIWLGAGDVMQWHAKDDLTFAEVCYPPYEAGRFENLSE